MQLYEAKKNLCSHLDINYDEIEYNGLFDDDDLTIALNEAQKRIYGLHDWKLGQIKSTITNTEASSYPYPNGVKTGSVRYLIVEETPWEKLDYESYLDYLSDVENDYQEDDKKYYSELNRTLYINAEAYESTDSIEILADKGLTKLENSTDLLFFSHGSTLSGTATFTATDATVTAATAIFTSDMVGGTLDVDDVRYTVDSFTSTTEVELTAVYAGTTGSKSFTLAYSDTIQNSGDDAIVLYAFGELLKSEKKQQTTKGLEITEQAIIVANRQWTDEAGDSAREQSTKSMFNKTNLINL